MSRSPDSVATDQASLRDYEGGWEAIYNLIDEGKSWSGNERNCAFLNTRGGRFADVSAASGLDFEDDGRAVAVADWDFDGRLDFWVTNRTAPRLRLLHNNAAAETAGASFVAFKLQGTSCNRDAIGARLELECGDGSRQIRTLHAGDGYLAQSSKWVHFGLGESDDIARLVVRWPGGEAETIAALAPGGFFKIVQGSGRGIAWQPPRGLVALDESPVEIPPEPSSARTWVVGRIPLPAEDYQSWAGQAVPLATHAGRRPLLINLWSRTCAPCVAELKEWGAHRDAIAAAGIGILALSVDPDPGGRAALNPEFASGVAGSEIVIAFETVHRALLESRKPLPVPCSLLLDADGLVAAIYKGAVSGEQLVADASLLDAPSEQQRAAALPFPGRWASPPLPAQPRQVIGTMMKAGQREAARRYAKRCLDWGPGLDLGAGVRASLTLFYGDLFLDDGDLDQAVAIYSELFELAPDDAGIHREVGVRLVTKQRVRDAIRHLDKAVALDPSHVDSRVNLASLQMREGMVLEAIVHFQELARQRPGSAPVRFYLANALHSQGRTREALEHYRVAHRLQPNSPATNNLAWILATHADAGIRDGEEAVAVAEPFCRAGGFEDPLALNTLAAAYAEAGRFEDAVKTAEQGLSIAKAKGAAQIAAQLEQHLRQYRAERPVRE